MGDHPVWTTKLLDELAQARAAIAANYQRLWSDAERALDSTHPKGEEPAPARPDANDQTGARPRLGD